MRPGITITSSAPPPPENAVPSSVTGHAGPTQNKVTPAGEAGGRELQRGAAADAVDQAHAEHSGHQQPDAEGAAVQRGDDAADAELGRAARPTPRRR